MMQKQLCSNCQKKLAPYVSLLPLSEGDERLLVFALNLTHGVLSNVSIKLLTHGLIKDLDLVKDGLDKRLLRTINDQRMKRGEKSLQ